MKNLFALWLQCFFDRPMVQTPPGFGLQTLAAILLCAFLPGVANSVVYWTSPSGGAASCAAASGTSDPGQYRTLAQAVGCVAPGDTIKLKNGTYTGSGSVLLVDSISGTSGNPITITAENPGLAFIQGNGTSGEVVRYNNADWWIVENLRIENVDNAAYTGSNASVVFFNSTSDDNIIRKNIVRKPNRWGNNHAIHVAGDRNLIEDNDVLQFHRNGIETFGTGATGNKIRRNYVGQTATNLAGTGQPNDGFVAYDSPANTWENNIFESFLGASGGGEGFTAWGSNNKYYGNICLAAENNCMSLVAKASITVNASGYVVRDQVSIGMAQYGLYLRSPINADVQGYTAHTSNAPNRGFIANDSDSVPATSLTLRNGLLIDTSGIVLTAIDSTTISHSQEFGSASSWGSGTTGRTDSPPNPPGDVDPALSQCRVNTPAAAPFKGKGFAGGDVGGTAIYEYVNGVRTTNRMFDESLSSADRGKILYGPPVIAGVNDSSTGLVRSTVHQRIGFGTGTCAFPADYAGGPPAPIFTQKYFRFHGLRGTEAAPEIKPHSAAAVNTHIRAIKGGAFRIRIKINCTVADCPLLPATLRYSRNGGAYTAIPDDFGADNIRFYGTFPDHDIPQNDTATNEQLTSDYATNVSGVIRRDSGPASVDLGTDSETEIEFALELDSDATPGDTYDFRAYRADGTALDAYTVTPRVTVTDYTAGR